MHSERCAAFQPLRFRACSRSVALALVVLPGRVCVYCRERLKHSVNTYGLESFNHNIAVFTVTALSMLADRTSLFYPREWNRFWANHRPPPLSTFTVRDIPWGAETVYMLVGAFSFCESGHCTQALVSPTPRWLVPWGQPSLAEVETSSLAQTDPWFSDPHHMRDCCGQHQCPVSSPREGLIIPQT